MGNSTSQITMEQHDGFKVWNIPFNVIFNKNEIQVEPQTFQFPVKWTTYVQNNFEIEPIYNPDENQECYAFFNYENDFEERSHWTISLSNYIDNITDMSNYIIGFDFYNWTLQSYNECIGLLRVFLETKTDFQEFVETIQDCHIKSFMSEISYSKMYKEFKLTKYNLTFLNSNNVATSFKKIKKYVLTLQQIFVFKIKIQKFKDIVNQLVDKNEMINKLGAKYGDVIKYHPQFYEDDDEIDATCEAFSIQHPTRDFIYRGGIKSLYYFSKTTENNLKNNVLFVDQNPFTGVLQTTTKINYYLNDQSDLSINKYSDFFPNNKVFTTDNDMRLYVLPPTNMKKYNVFSFCNKKMYISYMFQQVGNYKIAWLLSSCYSDETTQNIKQIRELNNEQYDIELESYRLCRTFNVEMIKKYVEYCIEPSGSELEPFNAEIEKLQAKFDSENVDFMFVHPFYFNIKDYIGRFGNPALHLLEDIKNFETFYLRYFANVGSKLIDLNINFDFNILQSIEMKHQNKN